MKYRHTGPAEDWYCDCVARTGTDQHKLRGPEIVHCAMCDAVAPWAERVEKDPPPHVVFKALARVFPEDMPTEEVGRIIREPTALEVFRYYPALAEELSRLGYPQANA